MDGSGPGGHGADGGSGRRVAFVLGGGGHWGAAQVGMLRALVEHGIRPDLVVGTSIGALNGAAVAASPTPEGVEALRTVWTGVEREGILSGSLLSGAARLVRNRTYLHPNEPLRRVLERLLPVRRIEDLPVPFQCVAAHIETASERWFDRGPVADAVLASAAVPGLLPMVEIDGEHYLDGGVVNSIPISRAVELGATELYVLHVARIERPLDPPRTIAQVAMVAFEIARRHRFAYDMARLRAGVTVHVLPTGEETPPRYDDVAQFRYRDFSRIAARISRAEAATAEYLAGMPDGRR